MKLRKRKTGDIIAISIGIISILAFIIYLPIVGKRVAGIKANGLDGVGTVINRAYGGVRGGTMYTVHFDFFYNGKKYVGMYNTTNDKNIYFRSIVGMKYKIKFLSDNPGENSVIFIDKPINSEYVNIEKERERIMRTYHPDSKRSIPKNARPMEEVLPLIPPQYR